MMHHNAPKDVRVLYRNLGQVHVFTSPDLAGLHHAHHDLRTAFDTLPAVTADLVEMQFGAHERYRLDRDFEAFAAAIRSHRELPMFTLVAQQDGTQRLTA